MKRYEEKVRKEEIHELDDIHCPSDNNGGTSMKVGPREYNIINVESVQSTEKVFTFYIHFIIYHLYEFDEHKII